MKRVDRRRPPVGSSLWVTCALALGPTTAATPSWRERAPCLPLATAVVRVPAPPAEGLSFHTSANTASIDHP